MSPGGAKAYCLSEKIVHNAFEWGQNYADSGKNCYIWGSKILAYDNS